MTFGVVKPAARVRRETAEQFSRRQDDEVRGRKTKSAGEGAEDELDILKRVSVDEFAETLDLAFGLKVNNDPPVIFSPFIEAFYELIAFRFGEQKISNREFADVAILERAAEIFRAFFNPTLADLDLGGRV